ncbi:MAG: PSD1 and planctomycete cytochrome C domain-containing protein [bacterium]|nr:PSD1 and planctomycete cytochrome C domain-containing protein [bacterium]
MFRFSHAFQAALLFVTLVTGSIRAILPVSFAQQRSDQQRLLFESRIRPVLVEHCYDCHSAEQDEPAGGLRLDSREGLLQGGSSGPAIVAGRPASSLLLTAIRQEDKHLSMPPADYGEKLPPDVIRNFTQWIASGAYDPRVGKAGERDERDAAQQEWWAWQPHAKSAVPTVQDSSWPSGDIDHFILAQLEAQGLAPSDSADRFTLVRRLALDLTGLPPSRSDLEQFAASENPQPIEVLVDKYLESPQFGERFGRRWLDVARYAESTGKDVNVAYPYAWRYRDYVIDAFNKDKPFDEFVREQIAGDLIPATSSQQKAERLIATGFLTVGPKSVNEMNPLQFAVDIADEQIDALSQAFLGVTIACARCHDHKFDPVSQRDYSAMAGILLSTQNHFGTTGGVAGRNRSTLLDLPGAASSESAQRSELSREDVEQLKERIAQLEQERRQLLRARASGNEDPQDRQQALRLAQQITRLSIQLESVEDDGTRRQLAMGVSDKPAAPKLSSSARFSPRQFLRDRVQRSIGNAVPNELVQRGQQLRELQYITDSPLFIRGEIEKPGDRVPRGLPEFLSRGYAARISSDQSGRLQLADWLTNEQNPLTARVYVNRVWSWLLGEGLVATEDNFGTSGERPSHPELLDFLASHFVEQDWSTKALVRQIVLSKTYQQSSRFRPQAFELDPENRLLWRANVRASEAEVLRDGLLSASAQLDLDRPLGSMISQAGDGQIGNRRLRGLSESTIAEADTRVRSVYLPVPRNVLPEVLETFDFADNSSVRGSRELTIVPAQALYWMNSDFVDENCDRIASQLLLGLGPATDVALPLQVQRRLRRFAGGRLRQLQLERQQMSAKQTLTTAKIEELFDELCMKILARPPMPAEVDAIVKYVQELQAENQTQQEIWKSVSRGLVSSADYRLIR